jgi:hypothetical protein
MAIMSKRGRGICLVERTVKKLIRVSTFLTIPRAAAISSCGIARSH